MKVCLLTRHCCCSSNDLNCAVNLTPNTPLLYSQSFSFEHLNVKITAEAAPPLMRRSVASLKNKAILSFYFLLLPAEVRAGPSFRESRFREECWALINAHVSLASQTCAFLFLQSSGVATAGLEKSPRLEQVSSQPTHSTALMLAFTSMRAAR